MNPTSSYLSAVDDAVCEYQNETIESCGVMMLIRELDHESGGTLGTILTDDNEPIFRAVLGLAKSFEDAATTMCKRIRDAEAEEHAERRAGAK